MLVFLVKGCVLHEKRTIRMGTVTCSCTQRPPGVNKNNNVRSQAKDSRKAMIEQSEFDEELSEQEGRLLL
jgi:hypothetical protein